MLGKDLGMPIGVDQTTINREYGTLLMCSLISTFKKPVPEGINVKEEGGGNFFSGSRSQVLVYCNHCKIVGHEITQCKGLMKAIQ